MNEPHVAYVSMEIAVASEVATYSGGLGVLAGDMIRAAADGGYPMCGVTLLYRDGYFAQHLDGEGRQQETAQQWNPADALRRLATVIRVPIGGRWISVTVWCYETRGVGGHVVPVYLLDTDRDDNDDAARSLTRALYGGDERYRLEQEALLGFGAVALLEALGQSYPITYHLNEGHAALLVLALLERARTSGFGAEHNLESVRRRCVFTTHTPVAAGHDRFGIELAGEVLGGDRMSLLREAGLVPDGTLNMSYLALRGSRYANAVAARHGEVTREMFPAFAIGSITNGVHAGTWTAPSFAQLFDRRIAGWRRDNFALRQAAVIGLDEIAGAHAAAKGALLARVAQATGKIFDPTHFTIGCARRSTAYKRNDLILRDRARLAALAQRWGGLTVLFAGKAHPNDEDGKGQIARIVAASHDLPGVDIAFIEGYDMTWGAALTSGVDLWLNTPRPPLEASGTSGMKATLNGVPSLSVSDGWWVEGATEGVTGWSIDASTGGDDGAAAGQLYDQLETNVLPAFAGGDPYVEVMRATIALNGSHFNAQRMLAEYAINAYAALDESDAAAMDERLAG